MSDTLTIPNRLPALGDLVRDKVSGFEGIAVAHSKHLTGCDRIWVIPKVGDDRKPVEGAWFDIDMLLIVQPIVIEPVVYNRAAPGGADLPAPR